MITRLTTVWSDKLQELERSMNAASEHKEKYGTFSHDVAPLIDSVNPVCYIDIATAGGWWVGFRTTPP
jgi:hypothetical protein